ncbi:U-box domain-containing protein 12, partial [Cucurbita argyrosperma subsp. sororia]
MLATISIPSNFHFPVSFRQHALSSTRVKIFAVGAMGSPKPRDPSLLLFRLRFSTEFSCKRVVHRRVSSDGGGALDSTQQQSAASDIRDVPNDSSSVGHSYVALFVRMLGLDHDPLDREQAIVALWKYSLGGKKHIDAIMQFPGCINLTVNLLRSESTSTCEAAAGLLRSISMVNLFRDSVAESGAIEEITALLSRPSLTPEVKEQSICVLWNLSVDEELRKKIANTDILPLLIKNLDDEDMKVKEAAGGVIANLTLSPCNHGVIVESGLIPKLAYQLKAEADSSKTVRKEARNALLELCKDEYYRILVIEEGLVPVPLLGAAAYKSFKPGLHSWPSLPDGTEIERSSKKPSRFGASELLLGLNVDNNANIEEGKINAIIGRSQQQFLARIGAIELEDLKDTQSESSTSNHLTLLPWRDGVARLVLVLELEDDNAKVRTAELIADASINEHMRVSFKEAGAIKHLVKLLDSMNNSVKWASVQALERLSISNVVCQTIENEGALSPLLSILKLSSIPENVMEKTLDILSRILDPSKEMKSKFYNGPLNGSRGGQHSERNSEASTRKDVLDAVVVSSLVEILKTSSPNLKRKAASILEFISIMDPSMDIIDPMEIESGLSAVFQLGVSIDADAEDWPPERHALEVEEAGLAISAASRLLTKLMDSEKFCNKINAARFTESLRRILKLDIPVQHKDWIAACLIKVSSVAAPSIDSGDPIDMEVALYETIPRLIQQMKSSLSKEVQESTVVELNRIVSEGMVDATRAVASKGGIFPLVKLIDEGSERAREAALAVLYNLSMDTENHPAILAAGAVPALRRIVLSQRVQWQQALYLLRTLPT